MISEFDLPFLLRSPSWSTYFFFLADAILVLNELASFAATFALFPTLRTGEGNMLSPSREPTISTSTPSETHLQTTGTSSSATLSSLGRSRRILRETVW